jgi:arginase
VSGVAEFYRAREQSIGLIWVDAHTDMNTPGTSPSGNVHGMPLAALTGQIPGGLGGLCQGLPVVEAEKVSVLGARSIDKTERDVVRDSGVRVFTMTELDERGVARCMDEALERASEGTAGFHLSFDLDSLDPQIAPGVGTPVRGGLTFREGHLICEKAARSRNLIGLEVVELNPVMDTANATARLAVGLIASALGDTIL